MKTICLAIALAFALLLSGCTFNVYNQPSGQLPPVPSPPAPPIGAQPNETAAPPVRAVQPSPSQPNATASAPPANEQVLPVPVAEQPPAANASAPAANASAPANETFCTMDALLCPDGSSVGRDSSNNCEFFPCPVQNATMPSQNATNQTQNSSNFSFVKWWPGLFVTLPYLNFTSVNNTTAAFAYTLVEIDGVATMPELDDAAGKLSSLEKSGEGQPGQITVRKLVQAGEFGLSEWRQQISIDGNLQRKNVVVLFLDTEHEPVERWCFTNAWPSGFYLGGLDSQSAIYEYYVLDYENAHSCE